MRQGAEDQGVMRNQKGQSDFIRARA
jgi:hypothetical protein